MRLIRESYRALENMQNRTDHEIEVFRATATAEPMAYELMRLDQRIEDLGKILAPPEPFGLTPEPVGFTTCNNFKKKFFRLGGS